MSGNYLIKYKIENGSFTKEQLQNENCGGCDQIGIISVVGDFFNGEPVSIANFGAKGKDLMQGWTDEEWFEASTMIMNQLSRSLTLPLEKKAIAVSFWEAARALRLKQREDRERNNQKQDQ